MTIMQSDRQIARRLIICSVRVRQPYFGRTRTRRPTSGHVILGVLVKFSGVYYPYVH